MAHYIYCIGIIKLSYSRKPLFCIMVSSQEPLRDLQNATRCGSSMRFRERNNPCWRLEKLAYRTPSEAREEYELRHAA